MYPVVYNRVHICTQSYTTEYIYVPTRTRQSTNMYPVVYDWVHMCTVTYTTEYICVLCRVRPCVYISTNFDRGYVTICTITASLCTINEVRSLSEDIARYVRSLHHWVWSVRAAQIVHFSVWKLVHFGPCQPELMSKERKNNSKYLIQYIISG